jgi:hypothetical protein
MQLVKTILAVVIAAATAVLGLELVVAVIVCMLVYHLDLPQYRPHRQPLR